MPINDFDRGLVQKFEAHDYEYNPAQWDRLAKQLPPAKNSRIKRYIWLPVSGIAAAIALLLGIPAVMQQSKNNNKVVATTKAPERTANTSVPANTVNTIPATQPSATVANTNTTTTSNVGIGTAGRNPTFLNNSQPVAAHSAATTPAQVTPLIPDVPAINREAPSVIPQSSLPVNNIQPIANNITPATPKHSGNPVPDPVILPEAVKTQTEAPVLRSTEQPVVVNSLQQPVKMATTLPETQQLVNTRFGNTIDPDDIGYNKNAKKTSLSLAGAYNRGSNNLGYMVGVNTRRSLGGKLYLEGDVAFASAKNDLETYNIDKNSLDAPTRKVLLTSGNSPKALVGSELSNELYYLQVTPVVGYQVMKNLSFGAGADVQRLFQSGDKTRFVVDKDANAVKTAPTMDYGLVGKTEYTIFRSLKAGVQYRYGLNDMLAPNKDYINRSYLQVQLKLGILGNK